MRGANHAASGNGAITSLFHIERVGRAVPEPRRWAETIRHRRCFTSMESRAVAHEQALHLRQFILTCLVALGTAGCTHAPRGGEQAALQAWRSPDSTLEQRARAASELVPVGSSSQTIISLLGTNGSLSRFYGLRLGGYPPRPLPDRDDWCVLYRFAGGGVRLELAPPIVEGGRFVRATPFRTLTKTSISQKP